MPVYQDKKTKLWYYRCFAEDVYGKRKQFQQGKFKTKREAKEAEAKFINSDRIDSFQNITFNKLYEHYIEYISLKNKPQSIRSIKSRIDLHILPYFKDYRLNKITASIYTKWQIEIEKKGYKHKYNSALHGSVVAILNHAIKFYGLKENIASKVGGFTRKEELITNVDFWTYEEYQQFINVVDDYLYKLFYETLYFTGIRQGECQALTWNDYDGEYLIVNKTISKELINGKRHINTPKTTKSNRNIKLDKELIKKFNELKQEEQRTIGFSNEWFIFGGLKPLFSTTITRRKDNYCKIAKVKKIRIHDFRHSHASLLLSSKVPIVVIAKRLGHSDVNLTLNTYTHMMPIDEDRAIETINKLKNQQLKSK